MTYTWHFSATACVVCACQLCANPDYEAPGPVFYATDCKRNVGLMLNFRQMHKQVSQVRVWALWAVTAVGHPMVYQFVCDGSESGPQLV